MSELNIAIKIAAQDQASRILGGIGNTLKGLGTFALGAAGAAAGAFGVIAAQGVGMASDLSESTSKVRVVFGNSAQSIEDFAATSATALGQSRQQALEAAGTYGNLLTSIGVLPGSAAYMSKSLVTLASDLASFNNASPEETLLALRSALTGETEPMKRFGVALSADAIATEALSMGLAKTKAELTPAMKATAAYNLILEGTTNAQGDFARTSEGLANQQRIAAAQWTNIQTAIGSGFLPVAQSLMQLFTAQLAPALLDFSQNVLPGVIAPLADLGTQFGYLIGALAGGDMQGAFEVLYEGFDILSVALPGLAPQIHALQGAFALVVGWVIANWPMIQATVATVWAQAQAILQQAGAFFVGHVLPIFNTVVQWVVTNWPLISATVQGVMEFIMARIGEGLAIIRAWWDEHGASVMAIVNMFYATVKSTVQTGLAFIQSVIQAVLPAIQSFWGAWGGDILAVVEGLFSVVGDLFDAFALAFKGDWRGFGEELKQAWDTIWKGIQEIVGRAIDWFKTQDWGKIGQDIIRGIADGISSAVTFIQDAAKRAAQAALEAAKGFLGIKSPSRLAAEIVGLPTGQGMAMGILQSIPDIRAAGAAAGNAAVSAASGPVTNVVNNWNLTAEYAYQDERRLRDDVRLLQMLGAAT